MNYISTGHKLRFYNQIIHCNSLSYPEFDTQFMPAQHIAECLVIVTSRRDFVAEEVNFLYTDI